MYFMAKQRCIVLEALNISIVVPLKHLMKMFNLQVFAIATDLVFTHFICPAIVNPEPYGITDAPISYIARFNLIQVAQILQMLAMRRYEGVDQKVEDLYSQFDKVGRQDLGPQ